MGKRLVIALVLVNFASSLASVSYRFTFTSLAGAKRDAHVAKTKEKAAQINAYALEVANAASKSESELQAALRRSIFERANSADFRRKVSSTGSDLSARVFARIFGA